MSSATLQLVSVDTEADPVPLEAGSPVVVGRAQDSTLVLDDPHVSRHHARIEHRDGEWTFVDTSGGTGSWIDGVHIAPEEDTVIGEGTSIRIGPRHFLVRSTVPEVDTHEVPEVDRAPSRAATSGASAPVRDPNDPYATRPSIFLRLRADRTLDRQVGWQEFHARYGPVVAGFARNAGLSGNEVDDVVQDVMFGFFRASNHFEYDPNRGRFRGYLKRITLNAIRDRWRKRRKESALSTEFDPAQADPMDRHWEREWAENLLRRALEEVRTQVQPRTMEAFELYGVRGLPASVVEKETGMTYAAIRHAKMRVLHELQRVVKRLRSEEG
ncbi:MAG: sigma-70 family RNA polymerase sigma factor [Phycisphaerae bacterium]|nr:sigma-70 family RNA polymerase sigma factor [Phycisphaerae bacterium]